MDNQDQTCQKINGKSRKTPERMKPYFLLHITSCLILFLFLCIFFTHPKVESLSFNFNFKLIHSSIHPSISDKERKLYLIYIYLHIIKVKNPIITPILTAHLSLLSFIFVFSFFYPPNLSFF